jgi:inner membrane transporter RhtA
MNSCFYLAIDRLPLSTVAAIEFLPVILLAALGVRTPRNGLALALAAAGVYVLTDVRLQGEPLGVAFAFANAALFALYIVLAHRVARSPLSCRRRLRPGRAVPVRPRPHANPDAPATWSESVWS